MPLRYRIKLESSRSSIEDFAHACFPSDAARLPSRSSIIASSNASSQRPLVYPLYVKGVESAKLHHGILLLGRNIQQLLWTVGQAPEYPPWHLIPALQQLFRRISDASQHDLIGVSPQTLPSLALSPSAAGSSPQRGAHSQPVSSSPMVIGLTTAAELLLGTHAEGVNDATRLREGMCSIDVEAMCNSQRAVAMEQAQTVVADGGAVAMEQARAAVADSGGGAAGATQAAPESSSSHAPWTSFPTNVCTVARGSEEDFDLYGLPLLRRSAGAVDALASTMSSEGSFPRVGSFSTGPTQTLIASPD